MSGEDPDADDGDGDAQGDDLGARVPPAEAERDPVGGNRVSSGRTRTATVPGEGGGQAGGTVKSGHRSRQQRKGVVPEERDT